MFSPGDGEHSGTGGAGFIVDLAVDASRARGNSILSAANGYHPFFNDPSSTTFHLGPDPGDPGLVVLLSTTPDNPGTPFQGPTPTWPGSSSSTVSPTSAVWPRVDARLVGKPLFGTGRSTLAA